MAAAPEIRVDVTPDATRLHALMVLIEKHAGAFRADLEKWMDGEGEPTGGVWPGGGDGGSGNARQG